MVPRIFVPWQFCQGTFLLLCFLAAQILNPFIKRFKKFFNNTY
ncbi:hypothetical protein RU96_GL002333 [Enterococcus canintestini]|uniref:Uncharacterized protein n=1 Tax=Enterococcus canintestini TaxID=317010 RepID=A0A1L8R6Z1_9ENTE|nr:hypothetical protein RU96_GL002333 [Enterococcus canintestini]